MNPTEILQNKIIENACLVQTIARLKFQNKRIVFTNGCFDIIHKGHIHYLSEAASLGNILVIGLNSDDSVKRLKGETRPIQDQQARALVLASMFFVNYVVIFNEDTPYNLINLVKPDFLVKGGDYKELQSIVGYDIVTEYSGKVLTIPFIEGFSSSAIIDKISRL